MKGGTDEQALKELSRFGAAFGFSANSTNSQTSETLLRIVALDPCIGAHRQELEALYQQPSVRARLACSNFSFRRAKALGVVLGRERCAIGHWDQPAPSLRADSPPRLGNLGPVGLEQVKKQRLKCSELRREDFCENGQALRIQYPVELDAGDMQQAFLLIERAEERDAVSVVKVEHFALVKAADGKQQELYMGGFVTLFVPPHDPFAGVDCG